MAAKLPNYSGSEAQLDGTTILVDGAGAPLQITGRTVGGSKAIDISIVDAVGNQITSFGGGAGLTDVQLRAAPVPVAGTFFQVTQPVSGAFFQVTQPVSIAAVVGVSGTFFQATQPVSGTFFQATQPVSLSTNTPDVTDRAGRLVGVVTAANLDVALSTRLKPADTLTAITTLGTITNVVHIDDNAGSLTVDGTVAVSSITTSITPGTGATNLGKAEDGAHTDGDVGVFALTIRRDIPNLPTAATAGTNNDYSGLASDPYGVVWVRKRQLVTYSAAYRLGDATAGQLGLTFTFVANTNKQLVTIYHTAASTKTIKLRKITLTPSAGAAGVFDFEVRALSAAAAPTTGNPAITPRTHDPADGAAEATCLALPTTPGGLVGVDTGTVSEVFSWNAAAAAAQGSASGLAGQDIVLYEYKDGSEMKPLIMRAATAEGFAVSGRCSAAVALRFTVHILFTEE